MDLRGWLSESLGNFYSIRNSIYINQFIKLLLKEGDFDSVDSTKI